MTRYLASEGSPNRSRLIDTKKMKKSRRHGLFAPKVLEARPLDTTRKF